MIERRFILENDTNRDFLTRFLSRMKIEKAIEVIVRDYVPQRTLPQNARLWKLHSLAAQHTGYTAEEMHEEALCRHFGYVEKRMPSGWVKRVPIKRSSVRNRLEFKAFMDATEAWYIDEFGVWLDQQEAA